MQHSLSLKIVDLEPTALGIEQELSLEEAKKIVGGSGGRDKNEDKPKPNPCQGHSIIGLSNLVE